MITRIIIDIPAILFIQYNLLRLTAERKKPTIDVKISHQHAAPINTPKINASCLTIPALGMTTPNTAKSVIIKNITNGLEIVNKNVDIKS